MKVSNFSIIPAMFVPSDEVSLSFTVKAESGDTIGSDGLIIWLRIPGYGEISIWRDPAFSISKGKSKTVAVKTVLNFDSYAFERGSTVSTFGVQLGFDGSRVDVVFPITILDAWYKPSVSMFDAERSSGMNPDDEGENLLAAIGLSASAEARLESLSLELRYKNEADPTNAAHTIDITNLMESALANTIIALISQLFDRNTDWAVTLWFGDSYESASAAIQVSRAFANVHLSGTSTGGVRFGGFSKSTEDNPLFECSYPAEFENGIKGGFTYQAGEFKTGGTWIDGKPIYRKVVECGAVAAGASVNYPLGIDATNLGTIVQFQVFGCTSDYTWYILPYAASNVDYQASVRLQTWTTDPTLRIFSRSEGPTFTNVHAIIEYTRTAQMEANT